ncbi:MAG: UDP-N-acetylmuramoyl-tripeptide--D-alanyl-D-alanine ligase [Bifidobacteriaceae bacterium]|jgi:UDP-N-acetylmuramoyl-tripeptide--D-alanyl-D-alanine ligase|nr:UDP-N-acetylmuramoyl-tripeptide--D-alanyl-D-alanine ligase [Bifidobacteriaceae bacterium]
MIPWNTGAVAAAIGAQLGPTVDPQAPVTGVVIDSRQAGPGRVFVALPGSRVNGHDFVAQAAAAGSPLALVTEPVPGPTALVKDAVVALGQLAEVAFRRTRMAAVDMKVIAVTGSAGKTTTKDLLAMIVARHGPTVAAEGSFNNHLGVPLTVVRASPRTQYVVLEMGANHEGEIAALTRIAVPDVAIVLGVGKAHLGEFGSREVIARAKAELLTGMSQEGTAVLNSDDRLVRAMSFQAPEHLISFGFDEMARVRGDKARVNSSGELEMTVKDQETGQELPLSTRLIGLHQATNVLAAVAGARAAGLKLRPIIEALDGVRAVSSHRMALNPLPGGATLVDDSYNANPESMAAAIETVGSMAKRAGRGVIAVIGEMLELGPSSLKEHRRVGQMLARQGFERVIVVGEGARAVHTAVSASLGEGQAVEFWPDTDGLVSHLEAVAGQEFILIKGSHGTNLWKVSDQLTLEDGQC